MLERQPQMAHRKQRNIPAPELHEIHAGDPVLKSNQCYFGRHAEC
jgi:hypothetical protein